MKSFQESDDDLEFNLSHSSDDHDDVDLSSDVEESEEEVLGLDVSSSEEEEEEREVTSKKGWGHRRNYYDGEDSEDDETAALEEEEAQEMQERRRREFQEEDYVDDAFQMALATSALAAPQPESASDSDHLSLVHTFQTMCEDVVHAIQPMHKLASVLPRTDTGSVETYLRVKTQLYLGYLLNLGVYLSLLTSSPSEAGAEETAAARKTLLQKHPVVSQLAVYRKAMKQLEQIEQSSNWIGPELEALVLILETLESKGLNLEDLDQHSILEAITANENADDDDDNEENEEDEDEDEDDVTDGDEQEDEDASDDEVEDVHEDDFEELFELSKLHQTDKDDHEDTRRKKTKLKPKQKVMRPIDTVDSDHALSSSKENSDTSPSQKHVRFMPGLIHSTPLLTSSQVDGNDDPTSSNKKERDNASPKHVRFMPGLVQSIHPIPSLASIRKEAALAAKRKIQYEDDYEVTNKKIRRSEKNQKHTAVTHSESDDSDRDETLLDSTDLPKAFQPLKRTLKKLVQSVRTKSRPAHSADAFSSASSEPSESPTGHALEDDLVLPSKAARKRPPRKGKVLQRAPVVIPETLEKRSISRDILKNRGLTPRRKKEARNPRVKHRSKYEKKMKKLKNFKRVVQPLQGTYGGEATGIKTHLTRSIKLQ